MVIAFTVALVSRSLLGIDVIRDRGELFHVEHDTIRNDYTLKLINKTQQRQTYTLSATTDSVDEALHLEGPATVVVEAGEVAIVPVSLALDDDELDKPYFALHFHACDALGRCDSEKSEFFGPTHR